MKNCSIAVAVGAVQTFILTSCGGIVGEQDGRCGQSVWQETDNYSSIVSSLVYMFVVNLWFCVFNDLFLNL